MSAWRTKLQGITLAGVAALASVQPALAGDYVLASGQVTEDAYKVGVALSSLAKMELAPTTGIDLTSLKSDGYVRNIGLLRDNRAQLAIVDAISGHEAHAGSGMFAGEGARDDFRAVATLWQEAAHFIVRSDDVQTGTIEDFVRLKGQVLSLGEEQADPNGSSRLVLSNLGANLDADDSLTLLDEAGSGEALQDGRIDGLGLWSRIPAQSLLDPLSALGGGAQFLEFTGQQLARADGGQGLWVPYVIPANTYPGQSHPVSTIAKSVFLVARADLDEEAVYQITKTIFGNLGFLRNMHEANKEISLLRALTGLTVPLHPGAARFYQEIGILAPGDIEIPAVAAFPTSPQTLPPAPSTAPAETAAAPRPDAVEPSAEIVTPKDRPLEARTFTVYFGTGKTSLDDEDRQAIQQAAAYARQLGRAEIYVEGHTDSSGSPEVNYQVATGRAQAVAETLQYGASVPPESIHVVEFGEDRPVVATGPNDREPRNRRAEITVAPITDLLRISGTGLALGGMRILADAFMAEHPGVEIGILPSLGSGGGIKAVLAGAIDLSLSTRPLKEKEQAQGATAFQYARTPFVFATRSDTGIQGVTTQQLADLYSGKTTQWPNGTDVHLILRPPGRSTNKTLKAMSPAMSEAVDLALGRPGIVPATTDQDSADGIEQRVGALGNSTLGLILAEGRALQPLALDGVAPTIENLAAGTYPLERSFYLVLGPKPSRLEEAFAAFLSSPTARYILSRTGYLIHDQPERAELSRN